MKRNEIESIALNLKSLLTALSAVDSDNAQALAEMPNAVNVAADLAEKLYCMVVNEEV